MRSEHDGYTSSRGYSSISHSHLDYVSIVSPQDSPRVLSKEVLQRAQKRLRAALRSKTSWSTRHRDPTMLLSRSQDSGKLFNNDEDVRYHRKVSAMITHRRMLGKMDTPPATPQRHFGPTSGNQIRRNQRREVLLSKPLQMTLRSRDPD